jgi:hypothetical protein
MRFIYLKPTGYQVTKRVTGNSRGICYAITKSKVLYLGISVLNHRS